MNSKPGRSRRTIVNRLRSQLDQLDQRPKDSPSLPDDEASLLSNLVARRHRQDLNVLGGRGGAVAFSLRLL